MTREISFHFPTRTPCKNEDGDTEWKPASHRVGKVRPDGSIENTPYRFNGRGIRGGVAYTENTKLEKVHEDLRRNPATGENFRRCRSGNGFWGKRSRTWVANEYLSFNSDELGGVD